MEYEMGELVIFSSETGDDGWETVQPADVPDWLKDYDVIGWLVAGEMCRNDDSEDSRWFKAERMSSPEEVKTIVAAEVRRAVRRQKTLARLH